MSSEITAGYTFADGSGALTAARLNAAFGSATIAPAFITGKTAIAPDVAADFIVFYDVSGTVLGKCTLATLITAMQGTTSGKLAAGNDSRLPATLTGIRLANGASADTVAKPKDFALAPTIGTLSSGAVTLDCSLNNRFTVAVTANAVVTLTNISDGDYVIVRTTQSGGFTCAFTTTQTKKWPAGAAGVISAGAAAIDEWRFTRWGNDLDVEIVKAYA